MAENSKIEWTESSAAREIAGKLSAAERHEAIALDLAQFFDCGSATRAAAHFIVAAELRKRAEAAR